MNLIREAIEFHLEGMRENGEGGLDVEPMESMNLTQSAAGTFTTVAILVLGLIGAVSGAPKPAKPCDIVQTVSRHVIQRIDYSEPAPLEEILEFIHSTYDIETDPPRSTTFKFEYQLKDSTLNRPITLVAREIKMIEAIKELLGDLQVSLTFLPGKLVFANSGDPLDPHKENKVGEDYGQPATRPESDSEGRDKPQPDAENCDR